MEYVPLNTKITSRWNQYQSLVAKAKAREANLILRKLAGVLRRFWPEERLRFLHECCRSWHDDTIVVSVPRLLLSGAVLTLVGEERCVTGAPEMLCLWQALQALAKDAAESSTSELAPLEIRINPCDESYRALLRESVLLDLQRLRYQIQHAPGHRHLYEPFGAALNMVRACRVYGGPLDGELASEILGTIRLLVVESSRGRRPWTEGGELYLWKCMSLAYELFREFRQFPDYAGFVPLGFCDVLTFNLTLDRYADGLPQRYYDSLLEITLMASEMFSILADESVRINEEWLMHPDDRAFTQILTGLARTGKARDLILRYSSDDDQWVRSLARNLLTEYYGEARGSVAHGHEPR